MRTSRSALIVAVAGLVFFLAACGDSGGTTTTSTPGRAPTTAPGPTADIATVAVDFEFEPDKWSVAAGPGLTVAFDNRGTLEHNWDILANPIEDEGELNEDEILWEISAAAGQAATATIDVALAPGTYQIVCTIPGHFSAGMIGELTVTG